MRVTDENCNDIKPETFPNLNSEEANQEVIQAWWDCKDCRRILNSHHMPTVTHPPDTPVNDIITDIGQYIHEIIEGDDEETVKAKDAYNQALITSAELELLHREALDHGSGTTVSELWNLRPTSFQDEDNDPQTKDPIGRLTYSISQNSMDKMLNLTLPVIQPIVPAVDTSVGELLVIEVNIQIKFKLKAATIFICLFTYILFVSQLIMPNTITNNPHVDISSFGK